MKGIHDFIVQIDIDFNETFKFESGMELYMNKDISADKLSNRHGIVVNTPAFHETEIEPGDQVLIDPTILYKQIYKRRRQDSIHIVDEEKNWYKVDPKEIIVFRKKESDPWKGYGENSLVEPIMEETKPLSSIIDMPFEKKEIKKGRARALHMNETIDVEPGTELIINPNGGLPYWFDGKEIWWVRNRDLYATIHE